MPSICRGIVGSYLNMDQVIRIAYTLSCALCTCLFVFYADRKILGKKQSKKIFTTAEVVGVLTSAACGFVLYDRIGNHYINAFRIMIIVGVLAGAAYCDYSERKISNLFFIILLGTFLICSFLEWIILKESLLTLLSGGFISGLIIFVFFMLLRLVSKGGIGYGDIKLCTGMGFAFGLYGCIYVLIIGQLVALILVILGLLLHKLTMKGTIPLAPFLFIGLIGTVLMGTF